MAELEIWLTHHRTRSSSRSPLGAALKYIAKYWDGLNLFLGGGRIEIDNNTVERTITGACPPVVEYGAGFQARAAKEVKALPEGSEIVEMLIDYAVMRAQARVCGG